MFLKQMASADQILAAGKILPALSGRAIISGEFFVLGASVAAFIDGASITQTRLSRRRTLP